MSNENKIRILYVQPGKYPEERFVANELHPLQQLVGGYMQAVSNGTKTKSSKRTLPLVPVFRERLLALQEEQKENRKLCGRCYNKKYADYICVDAMGNLLKPDYLSNSFQITLQNYHLRRIRFHDLRHPYVKPTTKKFASFLKFFRAAAIAARSCSIRYSWLMLPFQISPFLKSPA